MTTRGQGRSHSLEFFQTPIYCLKAAFPTGLDQVEIMTLENFLRFYVDGDLSRNWSVQENRGEACWEVRSYYDIDTCKYQVIDSFATRIEAYTYLLNGLFADYDNNSKGLVEHAPFHSQKREEVEAEILARAE